MGWQLMMLIAKKGNATKAWCRMVINVEKSQSIDLGLGYLLE